jgi:hypothetical protein
LLELSAQAGQIADLVDQLEELKATVHALKPQEREEGGETPLSVGDKNSDRPPVSFSAITACLASAYLLLVVVHYIIVWVLDLDLRWLFAATIFIPGLAAARSADVARIAIPILIMLAVVLGVVSVATMVMVAAWGDLQNALPSGRSEWVSNIGWVLSVALSFLTGSLTRRALNEGSGPRMFIKELLDPEGAGKPEQQLVHIGRLIELATPIVTAIGAVVAGMRGVLK